MIPAALFLLIELHAADGAPIEINPHSIISMRARGKNSQGHYVEGTECLLNLADGRAIAIRETCQQVLEKMENAK